LAFEALLSGAREGRDMNVERDTLIKFGTPIVATGVFVAMIAVVGTLYGTAPDVDGTPATDAGVALTDTGALVLVALLAVFVVGMAVVGALIGDVGDDD
jgi:hypothetical protein